ncbi:MAG: ExbD/TolR family protein [Minwuia sp.]|uniref:ExbD/TolR family protein n=1 Tax=Minwuia sp. TaxID=2493630 RepID=UPI003A852214
MRSETPDLPSFAAAAEAPRRTIISLTPLIDVVFILLIFFMLASSFERWRAIGLEAQPPGAAGEAMLGAMLVEIRPDGLRLSGDAITAEALAARVSARMTAQPDQSFLLRAAAGVPLQRAVTVVDLLSDAGARRISFQQPGTAP